MLSYTARGPPELGLGLDQRLASHHPSFTLQSQKASYCDFLEWQLFPKFREEFCLRRGTGQGWPRVIFSSLTALAPAPTFNQAPPPRPVPTEMAATGAGSRDPLTGDRDLRLPLPKTPGPLGIGQHTGKIRSLCLQDPQPQAPMLQSTGRTSTTTYMRTYTCPCSCFGRRTSFRQ